MKIRRILTMAVIAAISTSFIACSDDDDDTNWGKDTQHVLPTSIKNDSESTSLSFKYGTEGSDTTRIVEYTKVSDDNTNRTYTIVYNNSGQVTALERDGETAYTFEIQATPRATATQYATIVKKDIYGNIDAYITINSNNQVVSYSDDEENAEDREITAYIYSNKNIKSQTETEGTQTTWTAAYSYSKYNGIFKNVTTPQWFLVTEFDDYSLGQTYDAVSKITGTLASVKLQQTFTYSSNVKGFPTKFSVKYPNIGEGTGAIEYSTDQISVTYNIAR